MVRVTTCIHVTGRTLTSRTTDLPDHADIILDALSDNEIGAKRNRYDTSIAEAISWTLSCTPQGRDEKTHILSIDLPSNTDPDTGKPLHFSRSLIHCLTFHSTGYPSTGAIWSINPKAVISLGLVKAPSATARYDLFLVDIGLPFVSAISGDSRPLMFICLVQSAIDRAGVKDYKRPFIGDTWVSQIKERPCGPSQFLLISAPGHERSLTTPTR